MPIGDLNGDGDFDVGDAAGWYALNNQQRIIQQQAHANASLSKLVAEQERVASLPKCPACLKPVEIEARLCGNCRSNLIWIGLSEPRMPAIQGEEKRVWQDWFRNRLCFEQQQLADSESAANGATKDGKALTRSLVVVGVVFVLVGALIYYGDDFDVVAMMAISVIEVLGLIFAWFVSWIVIRSLIRFRYCGDGMKMVEVENSNSSWWTRLRQSENFGVYLVGAAAVMATIGLVLTIMCRSYMTAKASQAEQRENARRIKSAAYWKENAELIAKKSAEITNDKSLLAEAKQEAMRKIIPSEYLAEMPPPLKAVLLADTERVDLELADQTKKDATRQAKRFRRLYFHFALGVFILFVYGTMRLGMHFKGKRMAAEVGPSQSNLAELRQKARNRGIEM